jgi:hypothetical protein
MKLLLVFALIFTLFSCEKKTCWKCTIQTSFTGSTNVPPGSVSKIDVCDKTKSEIREYEKTTSSTTQTGGYTVRQSTSCTQQ